jgi:hypothetical protein
MQIQNHSRHGGPSSELGGIDILGLWRIADLEQGLG